MPPPRNDIRNDIKPDPTSALTCPQPAPPPRNDIRNDVEASATCPVCHAAFTPTRRQRYCTPACRQAAWRARHPKPRPVVDVPPATHRRSITVYQCPECDTRHLGQQWCHDCHQPCLRIDIGGLCPHCDEPVTISDILDQHPTQR
ncbi:MAG TPA: hypothetical protein VFB84_03180 [Micromonosporaceae bacterium]|nr:hypothetical protein [Micromonosporaceae bacterium]